MRSATVAHAEKPPHSRRARPQGLATPLVVARRTTASLALSLVVLFGLGTSGCSSCEGEAVPFGLDAGRTTTHQREPAPEPERVRPTGRSFPDGTQRVDVEGAPITASGSIRALWAHDVDGDGDRDAIVLVAGSDSALSLAFARREGATFEPLEELSNAPPAEGCSIEEPSLEPLAERWLVGRAAVRCPEAPATSRREIWISSIERTPRALEHLTILDAEGRAPGTVELALSAADRDEDGHLDLIVKISVAKDGIESSVELPWLDRPSGLARDAAEPERTLAAQAREGLRALRRNPDRALSLSAGVSALHEVLCREPGRARLRVGQTDGLSCGRSEGAGRAATTIVRALAQKGELLDALSSLERLETPGLAIDDERRKAARDALARAPAAANITLHEGPNVAVPSMAGVRLSALAFLDEDRLLVRGDRPRLYTLSSGELTDAEPSQGELRVLDPSGTFAVAAVERRCAGHVLQIVQAATYFGGGVVLGPHSSPLLASREPPGGAPCPDLTPALRADDGGFTVLGWAPQGLVAAREGTLTVVPLDLEAQPAGEPTTLEEGTLPPAPLLPGAITSDGRFLVELRGIGVVVHRIAPRQAPQLFWPEGWAALEGTPSDPAISPSGRKVAVLRGGRILILERQDS